MWPLHGHFWRGTVVSEPIAGQQNMDKYSRMRRNCKSTCIGSRKSRTSSRVLSVFLTVWQRGGTRYNCARELTGTTVGVGGGCNSWQWHSALVQSNARLQGLDARRRRLRVDPVAEPVLGDANIYRALGMRSLRRPENGRVEESLQGARERAHRGEGNCKSALTSHPRKRATSSDLRLRYIYIYPSRNRAYLTYYLILIYPESS